jgi:hypothetical protein
VIGEEIGKQAAAEGGGLAFLEEGEVLDEEGHAPKRAVGGSSSDGATGLVVLLVHDGVDGGVHLFGAGDGGLEHLLGADLAFGDQAAERGGIVPAVVVEAHECSLPVWRGECDTRARLGKVL